ncbi:MULTISPECIES: ATP-dependent endonuclease [Lactococcus]|uniref:ATP-dependent nuclease n=1 Tax=Lactococcus TaxID=1357 RepID=UPI001A8E490E|nr:AAA family ATPase [Lactococcus sp. LG592]QSR09940.1 AAA family ATPase [Lactococcus sp. LG592]
MYVSAVNIKGFKKYIDYKVKFNDHLNILIGENEAGKSTILEAIEVVLNQKFFLHNQNANVLFFCKDNIEKFESNKNIESLPKIEIELFFSHRNGQTPNPKIGRFYGEHNSWSDAYYGIHFEYKFDESYSALFQDFGNNPIIPIDFYKAEWKTFSGTNYNRKLNPLKSLTIDNSLSKYGIYDSFAKDIYETTYDEKTKNSLSHEFRTSIKNFLSSNKESLSLDEFQTFSISEEKTNIKSLLTIEHKGITLQQKGKGMENIIKTRQALKNSQSKLLLIEEPENHLSPMNLRKLISDISQENGDSQIIIATHESLIVNRLGLDNLIWIQGSKPSTFNNLKSETIAYFKKIDHTNILQFILANKVILVEGAAEYILMDKLVRSLRDDKKGLDDYKIEVISGGGITYKHYLDVAKNLNKPILVLTDNDSKLERIQEIQLKNQKYESSNVPIKIELEDDISYFTFEAALFYKNEKLLTDLTNENASKYYNGREFPKILSFMLNNKSKAALRIEERYNTEDLQCPDYISRGLEWLIKS